jgi:hypothetical protein
MKNFGGYNLCGSFNEYGGATNNLWLIDEKTMMMWLISKERTSHNTSLLVVD